jgi:hypothetical protein
MSRRILCSFTAFVLAVSSIGCNGDKPASGGQPRIKGGGDVDPKASGPVQGGGGKSAFKGND